MHCTFHHWMDTMLADMKNVVCCPFNSKRNVCVFFLLLAKKFCSHSIILHQLEEFVTCTDDYRARIRMSLVTCVFGDACTLHSGIWEAR